MQVRFLMPADMRKSRTREHHVTCAMFSQRSGEIVASYNDDVRVYVCLGSDIPCLKSCGVPSGHNSSWTQKLRNTQCVGLGI